MTRLGTTARRTIGSLVVGAALVGGVLGATDIAPAGAVNGGTSQSNVVNAVPSASPPNITDGSVTSIAQVGARLVAGGTFTTVKQTLGSATVDRPYLMAFDATTGALDTGFLPAVDGEVSALLPGPTSTSVYIGGHFTMVNGVKSKGLALLNLVDGTTITSFKVPAMDGVVTDLKAANGRLFLAGTFTLLNALGSWRPGHAGHATTGAIDPFVNLQVSGHHNYQSPGDVIAAVGVNKIDLTPDGRRMVAIGNFTNVSGQSRDQIVMADLTGAAAAVTTAWSTNSYTPPCNAKQYDSYVRAVQFSPDGSYFVVATAGGYFGGSFDACDAAARFETSGSGADVHPTWVDFTGGDSLYSLAVTGATVYVGGHQRWMNNPFGQDHPSAGAVPRPGVAALDPATGVPISWNPGRSPRGHGAEALLATAAGLWMGSDTPYIGNYSYNRGRLAFFPLAGGQTITAPKTATLPGTVVLAGRPSAPATVNDVVKRSYNGATTVGATSTLASSGIAWSQAHGAFMLNGTVYYGWSDGKLYTRSFDGTTFGAATVVDPYNDAYWSDVPTGSGDTYRGTVSAFYSQITKVTGMFFSNGRIYYTLTGDPTLRSRTFNVDSGIVGTAEVAVNSTLGWANAGGMFLAGGQLYFDTRNDGKLHKVPFANGSPTATSSTVVSGPGVDGNDWRSNAMFLQVSDSATEVGPGAAGSTRGRPPPTTPLRAAAPRRHR